jgi:site-specific DNA-methyltransferase (adenine-specific)
MSSQKYSKLTKKELFELCQSQVEGFNPSKSKSLNKQDLINLLSQIPKPDYNEIKIFNDDGLKILDNIPDNTVDLILTDPPYVISRESGMNSQYNKIKENTSLKTEEEWEEYKVSNSIEDDSQKENYLKYGSIYGKKFAVSTSWDFDTEFTMEMLNAFVKSFYKKLRKGGTVIIFFDLWKITILKDMMEEAGFKQIRFLEWIKTNPVPINSKLNYLTNAREIALLGIKDSNPTFNSSYDSGIYNFPIQSGKNRFHPTQKNLALFEELIKKHSNETDLVVDTFLGSGTTAIACQSLNRRFIGSEINKEYYDKILEII